MRILDLYCGVGGASAGYARAGHSVLGVDLVSQPDYPFKILQSDVLDLTPDFLQGFDVVHASPPCQAHSALTKGTNYGRTYPDLIERTRALILSAGNPYVLENVAGAPIRKDLMLCGEMFGLGVIRHRYFEISWPVVQPPHNPHRGRVAGWRHGQYFAGPYVAVYGDGGGKGSVTEWQVAMGIDWTSNRKSIAEAIPPAYTNWIISSAGGYIHR